MYSMTGFGRAARHDRRYDVEVEAKSVNHRFLSLKVSVPEPMTRHESEIEQAVRRRISRGSLTIVVTLKPAASESGGVPPVERARTLYRSIEAVRKSLGLKGEITIGELMAIPGFWAQANHQEELAEKAWPSVKKLVEKAVEELVAMRAREGATIQKDLLARLDAIERLTVRIRARAPSVIAAYQKKLDDRIAALLAQRGLELSKQDLAKEIALYADRCDISEENQRLSAHVESFRKIARGEGPIGRRLDFLTQEMLRETNTLASKGGDSEVSGLAVEIKAELERIKEQAENVE